MLKHIYHRLKITWTFTKFAWAWGLFLVNDYVGFFKFINLYFTVYDDHVKNFEKWIPVADENRSKYKKASNEIQAILKRLIADNYYKDDCPYDKKLRDKWFVSLFENMKPVEIDGKIYYDRSENADVNIFDTKAKLQDFAIEELFKRDAVKEDTECKEREDDITLLFKKLREEFWTIT